MTLQTSGQISINDVAAEYDVAGNNRSLTSLSTDAGLTAPHGLKEFYGLSDTIPVTGVSLTVGSFSSSQTNDTYQNSTVSCASGETPRLRLEYTRTGSANSSHNVKLYKNGNFVITFNTTSSSTQFFEADYANGDVLGITVHNGASGTSHTGTLTWKNVTDNNTVLASDSFTSSYTASGSGGSGGGTCFTHDMAVTMADNSLKYISEIVVGDTVLSSTGEAAEVLDVWVHPQREQTIYNINNSLKVTASHPIKTTTGWAAIDAEAATAIHPELSITTLEVGQTLVGSNGNSVKVETLDSSVENIVVYNLNVSANDTYYVQGILVHNK